MDKTEREAIRTRCEAATPGPWAIVEEPRGFIDIAYQDEYRIATVGYRSDAELLAHCRMDIPALLDALNEAEAAIKNRDEIIDQYVNSVLSIEDDRDRWKVRAEALERVLIEAVKGKCDYCKHRANPEIAGTCIFLKTDDSCWGGEKWEFRAG